MNHQTSSHRSAALGTVTPTEANGRETKLMSRNIELFKWASRNIQWPSKLFRGNWHWKANSRGIWRLKHVFPLHRQTHQPCVLTLKVNQSISQVFWVFWGFHKHTGLEKDPAALARNNAKEKNNIYSNNYFRSILKTGLTTGKYLQNLVA